MAIKPSWRFAMLLLLFHMTVATVVYVTAMSLAIRLAILLLILLSLFYHLARDILLLLPDSWSEISFENHPHPNLLPEGEVTIASSPASGITSDSAALPPSRMASSSIRGLRRGLGSVAVVTQDGSRFDGLVAGSSIVSPYFVVLCIRPKGRLTVSRVVFPDALGAGEFRELCVRLRFG